MKILKRSITLVFLIIFIFNMLLPANLICKKEQNRNLNLIRDSIINELSKKNESYITLKVYSNLFVFLMNKHGRTILYKYSSYKIIGNSKQITNYLTFDSVYNLNNCFESSETYKPLKSKPNSITIDTIMGSTHRSSYYNVKFSIKDKKREFDILYPISPTDKVKHCDELVLNLLQCLISAAFCEGFYDINDRFIDELD